MQWAMVAFWAFRVRALFTTFIQSGCNKERHSGGHQCSSTNHTCYSSRTYTFLLVLTYSERSLIYSGKILTYSGRSLTYSGRGIILYSICLSCGWATSVMLNWYSIQRKTPGRRVVRLIEFILANPNWRYKVWLFSVMRSLFHLKLEVINTWNSFH